MGANEIIILSGALVGGYVTGLTGFGTGLTGATWTTDALKVITAAARRISPILTD